MCRQVALGATTAKASAALLQITRLAKHGTHCQQAAASDLALRSCSWQGCSNALQPCLPHLRRARTVGAARQSCCCVAVRQHTASGQHTAAPGLTLPSCKQRGCRRDLQPCLLLLLQRDTRRCCTPVLLRCTVCAVCAVISHMWNHGFTQQYKHCACAAGLRSTLWPCLPQLR